MKLKTSELGAAGGERETDLAAIPDDGRVKSQHAIASSSFPLFALEVSLGIFEEGDEVAGVDAVEDGEELHWIRR